MFEDAVAGFALYEFRLRSLADRATAQQLLTDAGLDERSVPLLSRVDDPCSLAVIHAYDAPGRSDTESELLAAIGGISNGLRSHHFRARLAIETPDAASHFRLAVTESGRNDLPASGTEHWVAAGHRDRSDADSQLLWIGAPMDSSHGLLVLVGHELEEAFDAGRESASWPLPLSTDLGVRIYTGSRHLAALVH